jgi:hypothetical protein
MKKKLLIVLLMFISFGLGVFLTSIVHSIFNKPLLQLCHTRLIDSTEKEIVLSEYTKVTNPFFENWYDGLDFLKTKHLYIKNASGENTDYSCFNSENVNPWGNQIYLESKEGDIYKVVCSK